MSLRPPPHDLLVQVPAAAGQLLLMLCLLPHERLPSDALGCANARCFADGGPLRPAVLALQGYNAPAFIAAGDEARTITGAQDRSRSSIHSLVC